MRVAAAMILPADVTRPSHLETMVEEDIESICRSSDELTRLLNVTGHTSLAKILNHRIHGVSWTSGTELLEELRKVLLEALRSLETSASHLPVLEICDLLRQIDAVDNKSSNQ